LYRIGKEVLFYGWLWKWDQMFLKHIISVEIFLLKWVEVPETVLYIKGAFGIGCSSVL
jgi:hypothetical protein